MHSYKRIQLYLKFVYKMGICSKMEYNRKLIIESCEKVMNVNNDMEEPIICINESKIRNFLTHFDSKKLEKYQKEQSIKLPFTFNNISSEVNFLALLHLVNFGSGYRHELHEHCKRVSSIIYFILMHLYIYRAHTRQCCMASLECTFQCQS